MEIALVVARLLPCEWLSGPARALIHINAPVPPVVSLRETTNLNAVRRLSPAIAWKLGTPAGPVAPQATRSGRMLALRQAAER